MGLAISRFCMCLETRCVAEQLCRLRIVKGECMVHGLLREFFSL